ncbi:MAG: epoxyqueuosine reductase QueH, partial [Elusimicrobia bacterium]|nr:epoxyqueuosine reductase QueH [Elusimicrobiota bacterium]
MSSSATDILIHTCCAPCLVYPADILKKEGFKITAYWYNPNLH